MSLRPFAFVVPALVVASFLAGCGGADSPRIEDAPVPPSAPWNGGTAPTDPADPAAPAPAPVPAPPTAPPQPGAAGTCFGIGRTGQVLALDVDAEKATPVGQLPFVQTPITSFGVRGRAVLFCFEGRAARVDLDTQDIAVAQGGSCVAVTGDATSVFVLDGSGARIVEYPSFEAIQERKPTRTLPIGQTFSAVGVGARAVIAVDRGGRGLVEVDRTTGTPRPFALRGAESTALGVGERGDERYVTSKDEDDRGVLVYDAATGVLDRTMFEGDRLTAITCVR